VSIPLEIDLETLEFPVEMASLDAERVGRASVSKPPFAPFDVKSRCNTRPSCAVQQFFAAIDTLRLMFNSPVKSARSALRYSERPNTI
jgi:hypothetical protein